MSIYGNKTRGNKKLHEIQHSFFIDTCFCLRVLGLSHLQVKIRVIYRSRS